MRDWNRFDIQNLPKWKGFAWFGDLKLKNVKTGEEIETSASGIYIDNGRNMEFKLSDWPKDRNLSDYEVTHYITTIYKETKGLITNKK